MSPILSWSTNHCSRGREWGSGSIVHLSSPGFSSSKPSHLHQAYLRRLQQQRYISIHRQLLHDIQVHKTLVYKVSSTCILNSLMYTHIQWTMTCRGQSFPGFSYTYTCTCTYSSTFNSTVKLISLTHCRKLTLLPLQWHTAVWCVITDYLLCVHDHRPTNVS